MDDLTKEFLAESQEGLERMERCLTDLEMRPHDGALVAEIFRSVHTIKGTTGFLGFGRLEALAHAGEHLLGALREGKLAVSSELISGLLQLMDGLRAILSLIEKTGADGPSSACDDSRLITLLSGLKSGFSVTKPGAQQPGAGEVAQETAVPLQEVAHPETAPDSTVPTGASSGPSGSEKTLRIDVEVLNRMMNLVGELVLTRNQILQSQPHAENFPELARRLDSVTADLREVVMQARMQPVGHLFGKFPRLVRDLARACGRCVRIEFEGQETGLDKSLLEAIKDPLTHAVRNSVDHGIEPADVRVRNGKPAEGVIRLRAFHQNGSVVIEVIDDGGGISTAKVIAKGLERGLLREDQVASMTEREVLQMIFLPGFSTAAEVTHVSGRGVGMDVVRANVEKVGGTCELESRAGAGTTLRLRVPLTLAIIPALVVRSGGQSFALPQNSLVELVYVSEAERAEAVERIGAAELYRLRGRLLPLLWLDRVMGLEPVAELDLSARGFYIAVLEAEGCRFGMVVDDLLAPEEIVVKPVSAVLREIGLFSGATVLGNGLLAMILDVAAMGSRIGIRPMAEAARTVIPDVQAGAPIDMENSLVIYESGSRRSGGMGGDRMAVPLSAVERIESVPIGQIEYAGGKPVLQYRGELLPLEDEGDLIAQDAAGEHEAEHEGDRMATVLICMRQGQGGMQRVGYVVRRVLDVSAGTVMPMDAANSSSEIAMVKERVTTFHRQFTMRAKLETKSFLQEVA